MHRWPDYDHIQDFNKSFWIYIRFFISPTACWDMSTKNLKINAPRNFKRSFWSKIVKLIWIHEKNSKVTTSGWENWDFSNFIGKNWDSSNFVGKSSQISLGNQFLPKFFKLNFSSVVRRLPSNLMVVSSIPLGAKIFF